MTRKTLRELYAEHKGKVSDKWSLYLTEYDRLFADYRDRPVRLLEIGVQNGGSLEIWAKYFSQASVLIGCDINPECASLSYEDSRIGVIVGDANAPDTCERLFRRSPKFDIIIDDGSHLSSDIVRSFAQYFPSVAEGGLFIAEDLHCSYWSQYQGGLFYPYSSISFFKRLADVISHEHWGTPRGRGDVLRGILTKYGCEVDPDTLSQVHSIEFINSICVVRKAAAIENEMGRRVVAGSTALVLQGLRGGQDTEYRLDPGLDQLSNPWATRKTPPDEEVEHIERLLADTLGQNTHLNQVIADMRKSHSWRLTAPLRFLASQATALASVLRQSVGAALGKKVRRSASRGNTPTRQSEIQRSLRGKFVHRGHAFYRRHMKGRRWGRLVGQMVRRSGLVPAGELQISALSLETVEVHKPRHSCVETDSTVPGFHLSPPLNLEGSSALALRPHINVLIPSLRLKHMSGGPNTALLLAALLAEKGERIRLIACDAPVEGEEAALFPHMERLLQRPVARERIELVDAFDRTRPTAIGTNDLFIATAWWTAQIARYATAKTMHKKFIYLIQDFEAILHDGSTLQARALETYGLPHIPVINSRLLLDHLAREGIGRYGDPAFAANALCFEPAVDRSSYFPEPRQASPSGKKVLLFYARPTVARRNLFELGVVALRRAVASGVIDRDSWEVWAIGEKVVPVALGNGVFLNSLPWMGFDAYAARIRTADLLLSLMLSPHPSYPPLEMAASGKLVVTNSFSVKTVERMAALSPNIIVAEPTAGSITGALEKAVGRINVGLASYDPRGDIALPSSWDESLRQIVPPLLQRIQELRGTYPDQEVPLVAGYPTTPETDYERYRRARVERRRREGKYQQEPGLLSFVTTAYNTDPAFLEELGSSVLLQDGGAQFEWLILDNGSTNEHTRNALQELARHSTVRLERVEHNLGIVGGMRFCLEHARGRYILPLDSDDLIEPDCVHVLTRFIKDNHYPPLIYTDEDKFSAGRFGSAYFKPDWDPVLFLHSCYIAHLCAIDRELGLRLGLYSDKTAEGCHDWDSFIRFADAGYDARHVPEVLYSWRMHEASTSKNIVAKSYIADSHRATLQRALTHSKAQHLELVSSPLFSYDVDWWYRRKRDVPVSCISLAIASAGGNKDAAQTLRPHAAINADEEDGMLQFSQIVSASQSHLVHLCWNGVTPDDDEWRWDAAGLLELFGDAVVVGGTLHDGTKVVDGPRVFGFGGGYDCPDRGRPLSDPGYSGMMWKPRSISAVSAGHCVVRRDFLLQVMSTLLAEKVNLRMLGPWLGALAAQAGKRVVFSPFMRARSTLVPEDGASKGERARFLSRFWDLLPDTRFYSSRLGLTLETAYTPVADAERDQHLRMLQLRTLPYPEWFELELPRRAARYPALDQDVRISIVTPVYQGSELALLAELARAIAGQSKAAFEWLLVLNGPMNRSSMDLIHAQAAGEWGARLIVEPQPIGIVASLRRGLEAARGEYVVPVDADDLITPDAMQILAHEIRRLQRPDLLYTDEDMLVDSRPTSPYLRAAFDPVLALENSTIWHLCALKGDSALAADVYGDPAANWCQDWDAVSRIAGRGGSIAHVPEVLYHWRQHAGSTTNNERGDPRSLDSARHILDRHVARTAMPRNFLVAEWPENRGARELYISRRSDTLPQFVWIGDATVSKALGCDETAILVIAANGVAIESRQVLVEVARMFELHPLVGALGGLVEGKDGMVVDGCYMVNKAGMLESPWIGQSVGYGGPYALALKSQSVATTGNLLAFFRVSALKRARAWPLEANLAFSQTITELCGRIAADGWAVAFSPLVRARAGSTHCGERVRARPPAGVPSVSQALVRYGVSRNFRD